MYQSPCFAWFVQVLCFLRVFGSRDDKNFRESNLIIESVNETDWWASRHHFVVQVLMNRHVEAPRLVLFVCVKKEFEDQLVEADKCIKSYFRQDSRGKTLKWFRPVSVILNTCTCAHNKMLCYNISHSEESICGSNFFSFMEHYEMKWIENDIRV